MNRVLLVVIAVIVGCVVNMPQLRLKDSMKVVAFASCLYVSYALLNSQGLVEAVGALKPSCVSQRGTNHEAEMRYDATKNKEEESWFECGEPACDLSEHQRRLGHASAKAFSAWTGPEGSSHLLSECLKDAQNKILNALNTDCNVSESMKTDYCKTLLKEYKSFDEVNYGSTI